jgi:hypothetical protein
MSSGRKEILSYGLLLLAACSFRFAIARFFPNDTPGDGKVYAQIARNVLEQHSYSHATEPPYDPSLIRLPGYPLFLSGVYACFGHYNNTAVRLVQAILDTATCALVALVTFLWEPDERRKRHSALAALALAAACPFTTIYVGTILTETPTLFFALAMCLTATLAFKTATFGVRSPASQSRWSDGHSLLLWAATGVIAGVAVSFRPDSGLFAAAIGLTLIITSLSHRDAPADVPGRRSMWRRIFQASSLGAVFALAFCLVLLPWTIRNKRVFHVFQPLAPMHAEMPGEFTPRGYLAWLRTWLDDERYIEPDLWSLDESAISLDNLPARAFDSVQEKARVAALLYRYNHPAEAEMPSPPDATAPDTSGTVKDQGNQGQLTSPQPSPANEESDQADEEDKGDENDEDDGRGSPDQESQAEEQAWVEMTPEIDAGFAELARERIKRSPLRYYLRLPAKRAMNLWFDTHSQYYPFEGTLLPLEDLDYDIHQQFWLPLFMGLTYLYTWFGLVGGWFLWRSRQFAARRWLLLCVLVIFLRLSFFSTLENPEPRYVVEFFPFLAILGGIALPRLLRPQASENAASAE